MNLDPSLLKILTEAQSVTALTGAGISAESGIPTFRDAQTGLWAKYNPEELATPGAFLSNPTLVWQWYSWRQQLIREATPNPAHYALADFEDLFPHFMLITQNVDGLHRKAGSRTIIELHGYIGRVRCWDKGHTFDYWHTGGVRLPECPVCSSILRPDVVWFGESLPMADLSAAFEASKNCEVFFSIGTSSLVQPAASLASLARERGACIVEVNLDPTPLTSISDYFLQGAAGAVMSALQAALAS